MSQIDDFLDGKPATPAVPKVSAIDAFLGEDKPKEPGLARGAADTAIAGATGLVSGVQMLSNVAGADNPVSRGLGKANEFLADLESPYRKAEKQERAKKIKAAEESGSTWEEVKAYAGAFGEAPLDTTVNALGTSVPTLAAAFLTGGASVPAQVAARALPLAIGGAQGAGAVKGQIYEAVEQEHLKAGKTPEEAAALAAKAQAYDGKNAGQIALGTGLGALAGSTGAESAVRRLVGGAVAKEAGKEAAMGIGKAAGLGVLKETPVEMLQGGQERVASNLALQNEGFDTPTWQGVAGQAALEGLASAPMGAGFGMLDARGLPTVNPNTAVEPPAQPPAPAAEQPPAPFVNPASLTGNDAGSLLGGQGAGLTGAADPLRTVVKLSEAMGIDPEAGPLSTAAALAVDGPAAQEMAAQQAAISAEDNPDAGADPLTAAPDPLISQVAGYVAEMGTASPQMVAAKFGVTTQRAAELLAQADPTADDLFPTPQGAANVSNTDAAGALAAGVGGPVGVDAAGSGPDAGLLAPAAGTSAAGDTGAPGPAVQEGDAAPVSGRERNTALTRSKVKGLKDVIARRKEAKQTDALPRVDVRAGKDSKANARAQQSRDQADAMGVTGDMYALMKQGMDEKEVEKTLGDRLSSIDRWTRGIFIQNVQATLGIPFKKTTANVQDQPQATTPAAAPAPAEAVQAPQAVGGDGAAKPGAAPAGNTGVEAAGVSAPALAKREDGTLKNKSEYTADEWSAYTKSVIDAKLGQQAATPSPTTTEPTDAPRSPEAAQAVETTPQGREETALLSDSVKPAGKYQLPEGRVSDSWRDSKKRGTDHPDYEPTPRQQVLMDEVAKAKDAGAFYANDVKDAVAKALGVDAETLAANTTGVEGGDFGMDVYLADRALDAKRKNAREKEAAKELSLKPGDKLGTLVFNDMKVTNSVEVESVSDDGLSFNFKGKRGPVGVKFSTGPVNVKGAIERAHEKGKRKDTYGQFIEGRNAPSVAAPAPAVAKKLFTDPRTGMPVVVSNKATADAFARSKQLAGKATVRKATPEELSDERNAFAGYNAGEARRIGYVLELAEAPSAAAPDTTQQAQAPAEPQETTHNGTRIYRTRAKLGDEVKTMWAVETPENKARRAAGERALGGDTLHDTIEQAKAAADREAKQYAERKAFAEQQDAAERARKEADEARKSSNRGKSILERRKDAILDGDTKLPASAGLGNTTRRNAMQMAVDQGRAVVERQVDDTAAKKRDQDAIERVRRAGYMLGLSNENIPVVKAGLEAQARLKANDYKKPEYRVYAGSEPTGGFFEITKIEYEYAQELMAQKAAAPAAQPTVAQSDEFIPAPDGSLDYGEITPEMSKAMRRQAGKIRLQRGNEKFGLVHIEQRHGAEIRSAGFPSVEAFVADIAGSIAQVWQPSETSQLVALKMAGNDRIMYVQLQAGTDGGVDFYTVNTAFPARSGYVRNKKDWKKLWEGRAQPSQPATSEQAPFAESPQEAGEATTIPSGQSAVSVSQPPAGYKPTGEPFYREGKLTQGYAPFDIGQRVTMKESGGQSGVIDLFTSPDKNGVFDGAMVKFDNGVEQIVKLNKLEAAAAPPPQADAPKLTQAEAKDLMEWVDLGQKDGIKTHILTFYESKADKDAKRGRMVVATVTKEADSKNWVVEGTDDRLAMLAMAKKKAEEVGMAKAVSDGFVEPSATAPAPAKTDPAQPAAGTVENFGEKLPPARRAMAAKLSEALSDDSIAKLPLSQIWPASENEAIEDTFAAAVAHVMREAIPAKPRTAYKVNSWVNKVKMLRDFAAKILRGTVTKDFFMEEMAKFSALRDLRSKIKLLEQIDREQWKRIGDVSEAPGAVRFEEGKPIPSPSVSVSVDGKNHWLRGSGDVLTHLDAIKAMLGTDAPESKMQFEIRQESRGERKVFINKKGDKEYRRLMEFATVDEARKAIREQYADLVAAWEGVKARDNITERDLRGDTNRDRAGKDHRKGRDVSAEEFESTFGFRGGEFGKWVGQGKGAQERQFMLNSSYDALMDLSDLLGIPPKAISLEGSLGIAFGSRGSGWASAHFEPSNLVINLTKTRGAGALAHEWFHALDNYFARKRGGEVPFDGDNNAYRRNNYVTYKTTPLMVRKDGRGTPVSKERLAEWRKTSQNAGYLAEDQWMEDPNHKQGVRAEVEQAFSDLVKALNDSPMLKRAQTLDGVGRNSESDGYWSRVIERAARAFENYVQTRMMEQGYHNDFLANVKVADEVGKNTDRYPYLLPSEIAPVADAFKALFDTIQTKEDDAGNVVMFSRAQAPAKGIPVQTAQQIVDAIAQRWDNAPAVVVLADMNDPRVPAAVRQRDAAQRSGGAKGAPEGFFYKGTAYVVAGALKNHADVVRVLFHESLGHYGLRGVFGDSLTPILKQIAALRRNEVQAKADEYGLDMSKESERLQAAEEVLAVMAQSNPQAGFVKRAIGAIRAWLRANVPGLENMRLTDNDIVTQMILPARKFVQQGPAARVGDGVLAMSRRSGVPGIDADETGKIASMGLTLESARDVRLNRMVANQTNPADKARMQGFVDYMTGLPTKEASYSKISVVSYLQGRKRGQDARERLKGSLWIETEKKRDGAKWTWAVYQEGYWAAGGEAKSEKAADDAIIDARVDLREKRDGSGVVNFSRSPRELAGMATDQLNTALKSVTITSIRQAAGYKATDLMGIALGALGRRQLVEIYGKDLPLDKYNELATQMEADKNEYGAEADTIATEWGKLKDEGALANIMHDATLAKIDPDKPLQPGDNPAAYNALKMRFSLMSKEAKETYRKARDGYKRHHANVREAIKERIERSQMSPERRAALVERMDSEFFAAMKGVYFPLARFGKYVVVVRGADGKVETVARSETMAEAAALRRNLLSGFPASKGYQVDKVILSREFVASRDAVGRGFMQELYQVLDKQDMDPAMRAEMEDTLGQLYLSSLPDVSWAKHGIHRKGTPGFSQDARRAFAQNMFHGARYLAKLRYSDLMQTELKAMQDHVDKIGNVLPDEDGFNGPRMQRVVDEFYKRHDSLMNPNSHPLSTALTSIGFIFHLGLSPASALVNLTQTAFVAYPVMAAKWGFGKAGVALLKASKQAAMGRNDITKFLNRDERRAYDEAVRAGTIDVTMAHDLAGIAQGEDAGVMWRIRPAMRAASFLFHHAERFNRQATFVAAYRLARETGAAHEAAFEQATKATYDGHFDYSAGNRPRFMQGNAAKVILLFKSYAQNMVYTLARNAYQSVNAMDPKERVQARKALAGILATHAMAAGVLGLPMVTTILAAISAAGSDDDEPFDAQVALQNMLADTFGQKPAEVITRGLSRLTPWDISGRVGLDRLIFPDVQEGLEGQRLAESAAFAALGPVAGIGLNILKGIQEIGDGHMLRGITTMMPAALRGPLNAVRLSEEGAQDKTGIPIVDEVDAAAVFGQALGFSPSVVRQATEGKRAVLSYDRALNERRQELMTQYARGAMKKDAEAMQDAREAIQAFNEKNPGRRITMMQLNQSIRNRERRIDQADNGVYLPKNRREAMDQGRFALSE